MEKIIRATVVSGGGHGARFMAMEEYKNRLKDKVGKEFYEGTLNLKIKDKRSILDGKRILIPGFEKKGKRYGGLMLVKAEIEGIDCFVVFPLAKREGDIEIIAEENLRDVLGLKDNDLVKLRIKNENP